MACSLAGIPLDQLGHALEASEPGPKQKKRRKYRIPTSSSRGFYETEVKNRKESWTKEESDLVKDLILKRGANQWKEIASFVPGRTPQEIRSKFRNLIGGRKERWTQEETLELLDAHRQYGTQWSKIAAQITSNRTSNDVKNRFYAMKRKYTGEIRAQYDELQSYYPNENVKLVLTLPNPPVPQRGRLPRRRQGQRDFILEDLIGRTISDEEFLSNYVFPLTCQEDSGTLPEPSSRVVLDCINHVLGQF